MSACQFITYIVNGEKPLVGGLSWLTELYEANRTCDKCSVYTLLNLELTHSSIMKFSIYKAAKLDST